ncbi:SDR family NAD(P)-dependent oxidoreductase [Nocardioides daeguensis]|uniref:3-oxoacyl-[acyl-carrier-protein] reductase n=1 Tax=Nocardioides daeguensis TaxID=908359 RepID=A0ABP6UUG4_9ACTN|nr:SDR family NAD(P)-dependent oxidoreductase [Nocardioides daeguensis]MBV6728343.1 SDR family oxidoreductase [Nocardioides daeguensis]MCR1773152.1 SDR family oxidoreductase [Nocardioides daeguensis]
MTISSPSIADLVDLTGRTAIVTGGAMGIGRGIVERLAEAGASVVVADADLEAADATAKELTEHGRSALAMYVDVGDADEVHRLVADTIGWRGRVDILVNNAGIFPSMPVLDMTPDDFDRVIRTNLRGVYLCSREAALRMRDQDAGGRIINVTSIDALHPSAVGLAHYDASKHGVWGFTKNLALELAPHGIWVNAIAPGAIATPGATTMQAGAGIDPQAILEAFLAQVPMGRMGAPDDVARAALFLASDLASYVTGTQIVVDGGRLLA